MNYYLKPMNCPFHIMVYKSTQRSYRDLPLRWAELGTVYRYERSGTLHGLLRVRGFTQDDAHIICTPEQIDDEILRTLDFSLDLLKSFGFSDFKIELSVRDPQITGKYAGSDAMWVAGRSVPGQGPDVRASSVPAHGRRGRLLRAQDRYQDQGRPGPLSGSAPPSSSISTCRSVST